LEENKQKRPVAIFLIVGVIIIVLLIALWVRGFAGLWNVLKFMIFIILGLGLIGLVFYIVYWIFFREHKVDVTFINKQKLIDSAMVSKPPTVQEIHLTGDKAHSSVRLGRIIGWTRIQVFKPKKEHLSVKSPLGTPLNREEEDVFVFKSSPFPFSLLESPKVLRVRPEQHSDLVGNVYIRGFSIIKISEYYYLNNEMLDIAKIDYNVLQEAKRGVLFLTLSEMKTIMDDALGINPRHQREMQSRLMTKLPQPPVSPPAQ